MLNIEEEIKNQEEDNGDLDDDFHNDVADVADTETDEEVDEKHLILEEIKLLELPEADRQKQRVVSTEKMEYKIMRSQNNPSKNYEETEPIMDPMEVDYETETVKNVTTVVKTIENPIQENIDTKKKEGRLKLPRIRIQNARIKILSQVEPENSNDDIVFIIYLNETDSEEIESRARIEDFIFQT